MPLRPEVAGVRESPLVTIATAAERMSGSIKLCYGESDITTPEFICRAASEALRAGHTFYTHTAGYTELRQAIAAKVFALHGVEYRVPEIISTVGATAAIFTAIRAFVGPSENVVIISPAYAIFTNAVIMTGGEPREVPLARQGTRFLLDLDRVRQSIDGSTRLIVVNSPSNPTGWTITVDEQKALHELASRHGLMILADEVYERLVFDGTIASSFARLDHDRDQLIVVNSFSKTYNMTGWRLGWAQSSERVIQAMYKAAEFITSNAAAMVQQAGIVALRDGEQSIDDLRAHYAARRDQVRTAFAAIPAISLIEPQGAFYAFFSIAGLHDSTAFTARLLEETGLALAPGAAFGAAGEGYVRLCFAASERTVTDALSRFERFMSAWR
jgi:aspartate/methionine/tyrosine aminotransferase